MDLRQRRCSGGSIISAIGAVLVVISLLFPAQSFTITDYNRVPLIAFEEYLIWKIVLTLLLLLIPIAVLIIKDPFGKLVASMIAVTGAGIVLLNVVAAADVAVSVADGYQTFVDAGTVVGLVSGVVIVLAGFVLTKRQPNSIEAPSV